MLSIEDGYLSIKPSNKWFGFSRLTTKTKDIVGGHLFYEFNLILFKWRIILEIAVKRR